MKKEEKSKDNKNLESDISKLVAELFGVIGIEVKVNVSKEGDVYTVDVDTPESGLLIGAHGSTLDAIQSFVALTFRQKLGEWININVDVGGWRNRHENYLEDLARQAADRVRTTGEAQHLYNLNPSQRRVIHLYLAQEKDIVTESAGEGRERYLIVKPK